MPTDPAAESVDDRWIAEVAVGVFRTEIAAGGAQEVQRTAPGWLSSQRELHGTTLRPRSSPRPCARCRIACQPTNGPTAAGSSDLAELVDGRKFMLSCQCDQLLATTVECASEASLAATAILSRHPISCDESNIPKRPTRCGG
jgi:hypothetical protein